MCQVLPVNQINVSRLLSIQLCNLKHLQSQVQVSTTFLSFIPNLFVLPSSHIKLSQLSIPFPIS